MREAYKGTALVPALGDRQIEACLVLGRRTLQLKQERAVDLLDMDAAIPDRLDCVGQLDDLPRGVLRVGSRRVRV